MAASSLANPARLARKMRRTALFGLIAGAVIVGAFLRSRLEGRSLPGPGLAVVILGVGILAVSIRMLLPSYPQSVERRLARLDAMAEEQRRAYLGRLFRKQLLVVLVVLLIEVPIGALSWSFVEWRAWIVAAIATTALLVTLLVALIIRRPGSPPKEVA